MVLHVLESDAGDETLSYIRVFVPAECCLETQPIHIQGMVGSHVACTSFRLIQSKWFLFQTELCSQSEKCQLWCFGFTYSFLSAVIGTILCLQEKCQSSISVIPGSYLTPVLSGEKYMKGGDYRKSIWSPSVDQERARGLRRRGWWCRSVGWRTTWRSLGSDGGVWGPAGTGWEWGVCARDGVVCGLGTKLLQVKRSLRLVFELESGLLLSLIPF